jgi:transcriptional regulator with XRE-family HTH domain
MDKVGKKEKKYARALAFGELLREMRLRACKSQDELAAAAEIERSTVSTIERGLRTPTLHTLYQLARALDTTASALVRAWELRIPEPAKF